jgi:hypothetical protein
MFLAAPPSLLVDNAPCCRSRACGNQNFHLPDRDSARFRRRLHTHLWLAGPTFAFAFAFLSFPPPARLIHSILVLTTIGSPIKTPSLSPFSLSLLCALPHARPFDNEPSSRARAITHPSGFAHVRILSPRRFCTILADRPILRRFLKPAFWILTSTTRTFLARSRHFGITAACAPNFLQTHRWDSLNST